MGMSLFSYDHEDPRSCRWKLEITFDNGKIEYFYCHSHNRIKTIMNALIKRGFEVNLIDKKEKK